MRLTDNPAARRVFFMGNQFIERFSDNVTRKNPAFFSSIRRLACKLAFCFTKLK
jgi:hypothetical protein